MLNCSDEMQYRKFIANLKNSLLRRGYPLSLLQEVPYDEERRLHLLKRLRDRRQEQVTDTVNAKFSDHKGNDLLVLKCDYSPHIGKLRLHKEFRKLLKLLRAEIGEAFLAAKNAWWLRTLCTPTRFWTRMLTTSRSWRISSTGRSGEDGEGAL